MTDFIRLKNTRPEAIKHYKSEVRAIVTDRAADYMRRTITGYAKPTARTYENALQDGLQKAKLDVMAELFRIQHDLARPSRVGQWSRTETGLKRKPQSTRTVLEFIRAYSEVVRYIQNVKAHRKVPAAEKKK